MREKAVVFDIDGTLASIGHRKHLVTRGPRKWAEFYASCGSDKPIKHVIELSQMLHKEHKILIFSGRVSLVREITVRWLFANKVPFDLLIMRDASDYTPEEDLKRKWYEQWSDRYLIKYAFDDNDAVVNMWRRQLSVPCFQITEELDQ